MESAFSPDAPAAQLEPLDFRTPEIHPLSEQAAAASQPFVGRWNHLVSTTNWEKGRIIGQWREALVAAQAAASEYSDEAWGTLVGGVTGQHVGRLRRVFQRFGQAYEQYRGLYWSHFQAALDWSDAEMWLEGAVQNGWSVARMREQRWETLGSVETDRPNPADVVASEKDEDFEPARTHEPTSGTITGEYGEIAGPAHEGPDFGDEPHGSQHREGNPGDSEPGPSSAPVELVRPFEHLPALPDDLAEAFDALKLAILHHKTAGWKETSPEATLQTLDAMKSLVLAPSSEEAPF